MALEPVTGVRNLTLGSSVKHNEILREYEEELAEEISVILNIPEEENKDYELSPMVAKMKQDIYDLILNDINVEEAIIYNPENLREKSNLTREQIYNMLEGSDLQVLADYYYDMEKTYNINAIFLMALNTEESGHGRSTLALGNNNIGGVKAGDGGWATFESWEHSLEYIASLIDEMYLTETGPYYNGTSIYAVNVRYCEGNQWAYNLNDIAFGLLETIKNNSIDMHIKEI